MIHVRLPALRPADYLGSGVRLRFRNGSGQIVTNAEVATLWCDAPTWPDRFALLRQMVTTGQYDAGAEPIWWVLLVTSLMEQLGETKIRCIEAAVIYSISWHAEWRDAAHDYCNRIDPDVFDRWCELNHDFVLFAGALEPICKLRDGVAP